MQGDAPASRSSEASSPTERPEFSMHNIIPGGLRQVGLRIGNRGKPAMGFRPGLPVISTSPDGVTRL